jgi:hypothetical protein
MLWELQQMMEFAIAQQDILLMLGEVNVFLQMEIIWEEKEAMTINRKAKINLKEAKKVEIIAEEDTEQDSLENPWSTL